MSKINSIKEAIMLWGTEDKVVEGENSTSTQRLTYDEIMRNKEDAVDYLMRRDKSELISYLLQGENASVKIYSR